MSVFCSSRRRHTRYWRDWSSDVCASDLLAAERLGGLEGRAVLVLGAGEMGEGMVASLVDAGVTDVRVANRTAARAAALATRSEERRVGKEWRSRWPPYH